MTLAILVILLTWLTLLIEFTLLQISFSQFFSVYLHHSRSAFRPSVNIPLSKLLRLFHPTTLCKHFSVGFHGCCSGSLRPHGSVGGLSWQNRIGSWQAGSSPSFDSPGVRTLAPVYLVYSTPPGIFTCYLQHPGTQVHDGRKQDWLMMPKPVTFDLEFTIPRCLMAENRIGSFSHGSSPFHCMV